MRALILAGFLLMAAKPVDSGSIVIDQPAPYTVGQTITLQVAWDGLSGPEYPVVLMWCGLTPDGGKNWVFFRRWDLDKDNPEAGPIPVPLDDTGTCTLELWAYRGLNKPYLDHVVAVGPTITVS